MGGRHYFYNRTTSVWYFLFVFFFFLVVPNSIAFVFPTARRTTRIPNMSSSLSSSSSSSIDDDSLTHLLQISKRACDIMTPLIREIYSSMDDSTKTTKDDNSAFTIADGIVQYLLVEYVFPSHLFGGLVGEEDVTDIQLPHRVQNLEIPSSFHPLIEQTIASMKRDIVLAKENSDSSTTHYSNLVVFIDPIDGTREFSTGKGEQCSICIGFVDNQTHLPVAGLVYRPLSHVLSSSSMDGSSNNNNNNNEKIKKKVWKATWAAGAKSEDYFESHLLPTTTTTTATTTTTTAILNDDAKYLMTSNGRISPFLEQVMKHMDYQRLPSGGAGNKMLKLLETPSLGMYLLDRGVSKWDTCAAQAILEAQGGLLIKLDSLFQSIISDDQSLLVEESYTYKVTTQCDDVPINFPAYLTRYNARQPYNNNNNNEQKVPITNANMVKEYANICGMLALTKHGNTLENKLKIVQGIQQASLQYPPAFD